MTDVLHETGFETVRFDDLVRLSSEDLDALSFGVIGLEASGLVRIYNTTEERYAGIPRDKVVGIHFFHSIAQCMNNFMVAQRLDDEPDLDAVIDYVLTFRMRPTPVRLRMMRKADAELRYILIQR